MPRPDGLSPHPDGLLPRPDGLLLRPDGQFSGKVANNHPPEAENPPPEGKKRGKEQNKQTKDENEQAKEAAQTLMAKEQQDTDIQMRRTKGKMSSGEVCFLPHPDLPRRGRRKSGAVFWVNPPRQTASATEQ